MIFKSSALTLLTTCVFSSASYALPLPLYLEQGSQETDVTSVIVQSTSEQLKTYDIELTQPGAIDVSYAAKGVSGNDAVAAVLQQQDSLMSEILSFDSQATLNSRIRIAGNYINISMLPSTAAKISQHAMVSNINEASGDGQGFIELEKSPYANLKVNDSEGKPVVAIIGQGVDYTHKSLGGNGEYNSAFNNIANAWDGFPNNVVIGGFDFSSETATNDYNPLEHYLNYVDVLNREYTTGIGTAAASLIHQASDAKILAYKVKGLTFAGMVDDNMTKNDLFNAVELAMDPNLDGDMSDAPDILLVDSNLTNYGFFKDHEISMDSFNTEVKLLQAISAAGTLVVMPVGANSLYYSYQYDENGYVIRDEEDEPVRFDNYFYSYFNIPARSVTPEALAVGTAFREKTDSNTNPDTGEVSLTGGRYWVDPASAMGPTRGDSVLKPDILAIKDTITGAAVATGVGYDEYETDGYLAAAKAAATAASLMVRHPDLSAAEIKAIIVNTGILSVEAPFGVAQIGGGALYPLAANKSHALMLDNDNLQPSINIGLVDIKGIKSFTHNIRVKNLTASEQNYDANVIWNGEKINNAAVTVKFPSIINLAPNEERVIPTTFVIDATKLEQGIMTTGHDFTMKNWAKFAVNGYLHLTNTGTPGASMQMPIMILPRAMTTVRGVAGSFTYDFENSSTAVLPHDNDILDLSEYDYKTVHYTIDVENESNSAVQLHAMPVIFTQNKKPEHLEGNYGHIVKSVAGGMYPEQLCDSGQKLTLAINFFDKFDLPVANHFDRLGATVVAIKLWDQFSIDNADGNNYSLNRNSLIDHQLTELQLRLSEDEVFETHYIDLNLEFDRSNPLARYKRSAFPLEVSPNNRTLVTSICTDDMYHHQINAQTFNEQIAVQLVTDRQSLPSIDEPVLAHNFKFGGTVINHINDTVDTSPEVIECGNNEVKDHNDNCITVYSTDIEDIYLADYLELNSDDIELVCGPTDDATWFCEYNHPRFDFALSFDSPLIYPGPIICDMPANSTLGFCIPEYIRLDDQYDELRYGKSFPMKTILAKVIADTSPGNSTYTGYAVKIARLTSTNNSELDWSSDLLLGGGEQARLSYWFAEQCESSKLVLADYCLKGVALVSSELDYFSIVNAGSSDSAISAGQSFSISERAETGQIIGTVEFDHSLNLSRTSAEMFLINGSEDAPFQLSSTGVLSIRDASVLDFETNSHYALSVQSRFGKAYGSQVEITVNVINENDNAPVQMSSIEVVSGVVNQPISSISLSQYFYDMDGEGMSYTANNLPSGIKMSRGGVITGTPANSGVVISEITVSDGENNYQAQVNFDIKKANAEVAASDDEESSSGGAIFYTLMILALFIRRRFN